MKKTNLKAFSLIEMSLVTLVIAILIAGVLKGFSIVDSAKLKSARALTQSSPVAAAPGLRLWLEATLDESLDDAIAVDGAAVTRWNDINPQNYTSRLYARTTSSSILYRESTGINALPSIYFPSSASADFFTISSSKDSTVATAIPTPDGAFSYFLVVKPDALGSVNNLLYNGTDTSDGWGYANTATDRTILFDDITADNQTGDPALPNAEIITVTHGPSSVGSPLKMYINGAADGTLSSSAAVDVESPTVGFYIGSRDASGSANNWQGYVSEIIIFERKVSESYRKEIEKYLSKKYAIKVTH